MAPTCWIGRSTRLALLRRPSGRSVPSGAASLLRPHFVPSSRLGFCAHRSLGLLERIES